MRRILIAALALVGLAIPALAADNYTATQGAGTTFRAKDVGAGILVPSIGVVDATGALIYGTAGSANANVVTVQGVASMTPLLATVTNAGTFAVQAAQSSAAALNATVVGTGTFAVQAAATLAAETTKVIGTVNLAATPTTNLANIDSQTSRLITSATNITAGGALATTSFVVGSRYLSTPPTFTNGQEGALQIDANGKLLVNCTGCSASTAITTWAGGTLGAMANYGTSPGAVLVPGVNAFVTAGAITATLNAETTKVIGTTRVTGNVGGVLDAIGQNVTSPANWLQAGCQFNTTPTTVTTGNGSPCQMDAAGNLLVNVKTATGLAQGSTTSGQTGSMVMGAVTTANPSYTTAQTAYASLDVKGNQRVVLGGGIPITASATGTTGATTATLATGASVTTYICGFSIRANATAAATGNATVTGTITGTMNFTQWTAPNASGLGVAEQIFTPCVPASAANTTIAVVSAAPGTGGVVSVSAWGYQQ